MIEKKNQHELGFIKLIFLLTCFVEENILIYKELIRCLVINYFII